MVPFGDSPRALPTLADEPDHGATHGCQFGAKTRFFSGISCKKRAEPSWRAIHASLKRTGGVGVEWLHNAVDVDTHQRLGFTGFIGSHEVHARAAIQKASPLSDASRPRVRAGRSLGPHAPSCCRHRVPARRARRPRKAPARRCPPVRKSKWRSRCSRRRAGKRA